MRGMGILLSLVLTVAIQAQGKSCHEISQELSSMQQAQNALLQSMLRKNETLASTLDQYAENLGRKKQVRQGDLVSMKKSAQAFRNHQSREEKLIQKFEEKSASLISQAQECLKSKTLASQEANVQSN